GDGDEGSWFRVAPVYKTKSLGDRVLPGESIVLLNERLLRTYPVRDNIPVMLIDEASQISDDEVQRLLAIATG
ncbi:MAG: hypothetical protein VYB98_06995, partial [Actinomycetota bacterium]|nr:hypothetical protein [Actinomycetota bacterium]